MVLALLAAAALAANPPAPPTEVSGVEVHPAPPAPLTADRIIDAPSDDRLAGTAVSVWPEGAWGTRTSGAASLDCLVDAYGLAESCAVVSETPARRGFGKAALALRPTFKVAPVQGPNGPVAAHMTLAVRFTAPRTDFTVGGPGPGAGGGGAPKFVNTALGPQSAGNPLAMRSVTMLDSPEWTSAAAWDDLRRAWPAKASHGEAPDGGYAVAHCHVRTSGALETCQVIKEAPENLGFGAAATALVAAHFRVAPEVARRPHPTPLWVDVPIRFPAQLLAAAPPERTVASPAWLAGLDPDKVPKLFPPEAAAAGLSTGRGVARCVVAADGALTACAPEQADPDGLGFSEAAVAVASTMRMNPWSADAAPVDGAVVRIAIRLNLKP